MTADSPEAAAAFDALGHELRVGILQVLADRRRERPAPSVVGFAELRKAVGVRDSGRFRYHLQQLVGTFVERADEGYRLTDAGARVTAAILAGTFTDGASLGPTPLESDCPVCSAGAVGSYEDGTLRVTCGSEHPLFVWSVPPNAASDASVPELVEVATILLQHAVDLVLAGFCPHCFGPVEPRVERLGTPETGGSGGDADEGGASRDGDEPGPSVRFRADCETCGARLDGPVGFCLLSDPSVAACFRRHDRPLHERYPWELGFARDEAVEPASGEGAVRIAVDLDGATLSALVDDGGRVLEIDGPQA